MPHWYLLIMSFLLERSVAREIFARRNQKMELMILPGVSLVARFLHILAHW